MENLGIENLFIALSFKLSAGELRIKRLLEVIIVINPLLLSFFCQKYRNF
jgi:hypothetical protein